jgi:hypothetical protein
MTPFQALYGFPPPMVAEVVLPDCPDLSVQEQLRNRAVAQQVIKDNLLKLRPGSNIKQINTKLKELLQWETWST